jgi:hypothetical protein
VPLPAAGGTTTPPALRTRVALAAASARRLNIAMSTMQ